MCPKEWRQATVDQEKKNIAATLEIFGKESSHKERIKFILSEIESLAYDNTDVGQIRRFIYIISALYHHQRYTGLTNKQIADLEELADALLKINRIKPKSSRLSFLYNDLHTVLSEIYLNSGEIFESLLQRQVGIHLSQKTPYMAEYNLLSMGIYAMRRGNIALASYYFETLRQQGRVISIKERAYIGLLRAKRMTHLFDEALVLSEEAFRLKGTRQNFKVELSWEQECRNVALTGNLLPLLNRVKKRSSHYEASYVLEAFYLIRAVSTVRYFKTLPKLSSLVQYKDLYLEKSSTLYKLAKQIELAYDTEILFKKRLSDMKIAFQLIKKLRNVDKELLAWLAMTRWFYRNRYMELAAFTSEEYKALSLRITSGKSPDALLIAKDLNIDWTSKIRETPSKAIETAS